MKITGWTYWNDSKYKDADELSLETFLNLEEIIINEIKNKGYKFSGSYHQNGKCGCPIVNNKYIYCVSMRKWGDIIARAYDLPNEDGLAYVLWAWGRPENETEVYPEA